MKLFRCSSLYKLMGDAQSIALELRNEEIETLIKKKNRSDVENATIEQLKLRTLSDMARTEIRSIVKEDLTTFKSFKGNQYTAKGNALEEIAIDLSGKVRFRQLKKHSGRLENELITGECDALDLNNKLIIDTKCSWDIGTHPFFQDEAEEKAKKAGYDWQMQGYMWLYDCEVAEVDFWLLPCPIELTNDWDDREQLINLVEQIDLRERLTTVRYQRDESMIQKIKDKIPHAQEYYAKLYQERIKAKVAA
ncbi:hypothetical protein [Acinetobacter baumannii]|uniref:hypothetical protein n=1 Tax=Acinetobacter baumannii TaxID=470 RepID=UPI002741366F|nr:hypothetical protein [Acinetobacter baumannii]MDP7806366.1 hypothetical protein [Acinetobacter baumannii]MDP7859111.1 hypothetical protein [Acinetobacter baumannii]MDP7877840.1 hypothetical protein [Acinetobacter baumannii]